jgi:hypothetical protein
MKINYAYLVLLFFTTVFYAQTNSGIGYQAVIFKPGVQSLPGVMVSTTPMANTNICLRFSFLDGFSDIEYQETRTVTTDEFGMVNTTIGQGIQSAGYALSFQEILWNNTDKSLIVELDDKGLCSSFIEISNQPFSSAPFAFNAITANNVSGVVALVNGGTGAFSAADALVNLGAEDILNKSIDLELDADSNTKYPSVKAVKKYVDKLAEAALKENIMNYIAIDGQVQFKTLMPIVDGNTVGLYRNGVRLNIEIVDVNTIQLEAGVICYAGDEIKVVQFY